MGRVSAFIRPLVAIAPGWPAQFLSMSPPGTQAGHQFRLRGKGMSVLRSTQRGDMYVEATVETPVNLTPRQQELLREFDTAGEADQTHPQSSGFFQRVKEFFAGSASE